MRPPSRGLRDRLPRSRLLRVLLGIALLIGGVLGFLPILGFWMIPLGIAVLATDSPAIRRLWRRTLLRFGRLKEAVRARWQD